MNEQRPEPVLDSFEERSRVLFNDSVDGVDFAVRSRLTQARNAAIEAASARRRPWFSRVGVLAPAGMTAAAVLGAVLWLGSPLGQHAATVTADGQPNLEDLEIVASSDEGGDAMDMLQDDIEFYDWADKAASSGPATAS
jgi:hypothetical protein